jgi:hypothetical protein
MLIKQIMAVETSPPPTENIGQQLGNVIEGDNILIKGNATIYDNAGVINWASLISLLAQVLFFASAVASFIFLIWGGITLITSSGEKTKTAEGRDRLTYAAIGLLITSVAFVLWKLILGVIGVDGLDSGF